MLAAANASLSAQTYDVDLSTITNINRNLDENCSTTILYRNVVAGDLDADGDGIEPPNSAFTIEIDDDNPSNGNILDGCGTFSFTITPTPGGGLIGFISGFGFINASDVTPPTQFLTASPSGPFFTTELENITINTLPSSVSRTFIVDGQTSFPIMNTIDPALMMRLLAGGDIPRFTDGCSDISVTVSDALDIDGDCDDIVITRTFTATDFSADCNLEDEGNSSTVVSYEIVLERPSGANVQSPPGLATFECTDPNVVEGVFPDPSTTDYPFLNTPDGPFYLTQTFGNVGASYSDSEAIVTCDDTYKFVRTWTVIDWCDPENVRVFTQLVKVGDTNAPTIIAPAQDLDFDGIADDGPLVFSTNAPGCGAFIPTSTSGLVITDGCGEVTAVTAFVLLNGDEDNIVGPINVLAINPVDRLTPFLPAGPHTLRYVAADACGNESRMDLDIIIEDRSGPVVIAENALNVSLSNNGFAEVMAEDVDNGSYDDCTAVTLEIAFANPSSMLAIGSFGPSITLTCIDVGAIPVILRVTDQNGNSNQRMSIINVVDNSAPLCIAPGPMTLDCATADNMLPEDINIFFNADPIGTTNLLNELFGEPTSLDNCGNELVTQSVFSELNDCGSGLISRSFTVTDARGFVSAPGCSQIITVGGIRSYTIKFPADASTTCGNVPVFESVTAEEFGCDLIVSTMQTDTFFAASDACFKLRRTIEVLNWCEYNGIDEPYNVPRDADGDGNFEEPTYLHIIPNGNTNALDDEAILDVDNDRSNSNSIRPLDVDDNFDIAIDSDNDGDTGFANSLSRGSYRYVQFVKVYDFTAPTITNISSDVDGSVNCNGGTASVSYSVLDDCVQNNVTTTAEIDFNFVVANGFNADRSVLSSEITADGNGNFALNFEQIAVGQHAVRVRGFDGCGNTNGRIIPFTMEDGSGLLPICIGTLTFVLMPDGNGGGLAQVDADDFVVDVTGNCTGGDILYSIYREEEEIGVPGFTPQTGREDFLVNCDDLGDLAVRVYTFSDNGNFAECSVTAQIQAFNEDVCPDGGLGSLAGFIVSPFNDLLSDIQVHITDMANMDEMQYTDENGSFLFTALQEGGEYMVRPAMDDMVDIQKVKTSDINKIMNHVLGIIPIENPYIMIAGDVDADGYITIGDMVAIRRVILGLDDTYVNGPTFRFIQRDFDLEGLTEGWDPAMFPSTFTVDPLDGHNREADFIAVEIGDVYIQAAGRESEALEATDELLAIGERYELNLTAGNLSGFQGTIEAAEGLSIESWSSDLLGAGNVNETLLEEGVLAISFNDQKSLAGESVITLNLRATEELRISDYLSVTDRMTYAEAITATGEAASLILSFSETAGGAGFILHQNFPNPVSAQTTIVFEMPTAETVDLEVHDIQGRLLHTRSIPADAGRNTITLSTNDDLNNTTGILTYTLRVGKEHLTKRMTVVAR